jgi:hypothetical protein
VINKRALALLLVGSFLGGCDAGAGPATKAVAVEDPRVTLGRTIDVVLRGNYRFAASGDGYRVQADLALPTGAEAVEWADGENAQHAFSFRLVGTARYVRMPEGSGEGLISAEELAELTARGGKSAKRAELLRTMQQTFDGVRWMRIGPRKADGDRYDRYHVPDGSGVAAVLKTVKSAGREGNEIAGVLDLTGQVADTLPWTSDDITKMGPSAASVPFTAGIAPNGLVTRIVVRVPARGKIKAGNWVVSLSRYGIAKPPPTPAKSELINLPEF